jgi:phenylacetate-CoA oxygenase PaaI subunit
MSDPDPVAVDALDPELQAALARIVTTVADTKRLLGIRYSDWVLGAPSLETNIAIASMAQDEWGHARLLYSMLKELGHDPREVEHERPARAYASVDVLDEPLEDWASVVAAMAVVDGALTAALEVFGGGRWEVARGRVPKMVAEEAFHADLARAWVRRLASGSEEGRARLRSAMVALLPRVLAWLDPDDAPARRLEEAGLTGSGEAAVHGFLERIAGLLDAADVPLDARAPDRSGWDVERGRGPGHPAEEAVERARGDRNRALFVE